MASKRDLALKLLCSAQDDQAATVALLDVSSVSDTRCTVTPAGKAIQFLPHS